MKLKFFFIFLVNFYSHSLVACPTPTNVNHLVIGIEGYLGAEMFNSPVERMVRSVGQSSEFAFSGYSQNGLLGRSSVRQILRCIEQWKDSSGSSLRLTIIGHSFGGRDSVKLAKELSKRRIAVNDLIILDGRNGTDPSSCRGNRANGRSYRVPSNVQRATNYYQCQQGLKGRVLSGRDSRGLSPTNIQVSGTHVTMPQSNEVLQGVRDLLASPPPRVVSSPSENPASSLN